MTLARPTFPLFFLLCLSSTAYSGSPWGDFLQNPTEERIAEIRASIAPAPEPCDQAALPSEAETHRLLGLVQDGNESAFRIGLLVSRCLGVGDLEDFYRATGMFLEVQPGVFLRIVSECASTARNLRYMATMLPLNLVDNPQGMIAAVDRRIAIVEAVRDAGLIEIKAKALTFLRTERNDLARIARRMR